MFTGILFFALGLVFSILSKALIGLPVKSLQETFAANLAVAFFVIISAVLLGIGSGVIIHWLIAFAKPLSAGILSLILAAVALFVGVGASLGLIVSNGWTALQALFTFVTLSITLFIGSLFDFFASTDSVVKEVKKFFRLQIKKLRK